MTTETNNEKTFGKELLLEEKKVEWINLENYPNYEILVDSETGLPTGEIAIRKQSNSKTVKQHRDKNGYVRIYINGKSEYLHRVIATEFVPNEDPIVNEQIDHIDRDKNNNSPYNLRWCNPIVNNSNRGKINRHKKTKLDNLPGAMLIKSWRTRRHGVVKVKQEYYYIFDDKLYRHKNNAYILCEANTNKYTIKLDNGKAIQPYKNLKHAI